MDAVHVFDAVSRERLYEIVFIVKVCSCCIDDNFIFRILVCRSLHSIYGADHLLDRMGMAEDLRASKLAVIILMIWVQFVSVIFRRRELFDSVTRFIFDMDLSIGMNQCVVHIKDVKSGVFCYVFPK